MKLEYHIRTAGCKNLDIYGSESEIRINISSDWSKGETINISRSELMPLMITLFAWLRPNPLRPLTSMTHEEFVEFFGSDYHPTYMAEKIASFYGIYGLHKFISQHGQYDSYLKMYYAGFDVTFTLGREGGLKNEK